VTKERPEKIRSGGEPLCSLLVLVNWPRKLSGLAASDSSEQTKGSYRDRETTGKTKRVRSKGAVAQLDTIII